MARKSLEELRKEFSSSGNDNADWKKYFPFWKMPDDTTTIIRFLPDLDEDNPKGFLIENFTHSLVINGEKKTVPCINAMHKEHGESCPICELSSQYYKEEGDESENGKKYYRKRSYISQIVVIEAPFDYDAEPLVKIMEFGPAIYKQIQTAFKSGDLEDYPDDFFRGYNFRINKTKDGKWASYNTSSFSPKQTSLSDDLIAAIKPNLRNLADHRTKFMTRSVLEAMLAAERTGKAFHEDSDDADPVAESAPQITKPALTTVSTPKVEVKEVSASVDSAPASVESPAASGGVSSKAKEALARLEARRKAASGS